MRVAHVITRLIVGGAQENTIASVLGLRKKPGVQVSLFSGPTTGPEGSLEHWLEAAGQPLTIVPELVRPVHPWNDWRALHRLQTHFARTQPDIVHTHSGKAGVLGRLAAARAGVRVIVHTIHGPSFGSFQGALSNFVFRGAERYAAKVTTHFVVVANAMRDQYLAAGIASPEKYTRIFSGFELAPFLASRNDTALRAKYGLSPADLVIGKIARLCPRKGHEDLFAVAPELMKSCPNLKLLLVGDGEFRSRFERLARDCGLQDRFVFTGLVPPEAVPGLVGIMDVLVHLSSREGLARALPQALASGRPVVAYDCDGAKEICIPGETGFLVRPGDLASLRGHILNLAQNPDLRRKLGEQGRERVRRQFGVQQMVDAIYGLYLHLTSAKLQPA